MHRIHLNIRALAVHPHSLIQCPQTLNEDDITTPGATFSYIYSLLFMAGLLLLLGDNVPLSNPCWPWTYRLLVLASRLLRLWACAAVPHDIYLFIEKINCMKYQKTKVPVPTPPRIWTSEPRFMTTVHGLSNAPGIAFSSSRLESTVATYQGNFSLQQIETIIEKNKTIKSQCCGTQSQWINLQYNSCT